MWDVVLLVVQLVCLAVLVVGGALSLWSLAWLTDPRRRKP